jgi:hypothetical protein
MVCVSRGRDVCAVSALCPSMCGFVAHCSRDTNHGCGSDPGPVEYTADATLHVTSIFGVVEVRKRVCVACAIEVQACSETAQCRLQWSLSTLPYRRSRDDPHPVRTRFKRNTCKCARKDRPSGFGLVRAPAIQSGSGHEANRFITQHALTCFGMHVFALRSTHECAADVPRAGHVAYQRACICRGTLR